MSHATMPIDERFWSKVDKSSGPDECWPWLGWIDTDGYGRFDIPVRTTISASRMAYKLDKGSIPKGLIVCHKCGNRICVNPSHLYAGTYSDNNKDTYRQGRKYQLGESAFGAKLTNFQVLAIRSLYKTGRFTQKELGKKYGVDHTTISCIITRKSWSHI
jgi:hypothetical protein